MLEYVYLSCGCEFNAPDIGIICPECGSADIILAEQE